MYGTIETTEEEVVVVHVDFCLETMRKIMNNAAPLTRLEPATSQT